MPDKKATHVQWFPWFGWTAEKVEAWLESKAASGWHLTKADRLLNRFHFDRGTPQSVRFFIDYPAEESAKYTAVMEEAGWTLCASALGWHIWRLDREGAALPAACRDDKALIERHGRLLTVFVLVLIALIIPIPTYVLLGRMSQVFNSPLVKAAMAVYALLIALTAYAVYRTYREIQKLKARKP